jgi:hypothetical protein
MAHFGRFGQIKHMGRRSAYRCRGPASDSAGSGLFFTADPCYHNSMDIKDILAKIDTLAELRALKSKGAS